MPVARGAASRKVPKNLAVSYLANDHEHEEKRNPDTILLAEMIYKRGSKETDDFKPRWVTVTNSSLSYAAYSNTGVIDSIDFGEVMGIASKAAGAKPHEQTDGAVHGNTQNPVEAPVQRNSVFWRSSDAFVDERRAAFAYSLDAVSFALFTKPHGYFRGRVFVFQCESRTKTEQWTELITRVLCQRKDDQTVKISAIGIARRRVRWFYVGEKCQIVIALVIGSNFVVNMAETQLIKRMTPEANSIFENVDLGYTIFFTVELMINMFGTLTLDFFRDPWNYFDSFVVAISLSALVVPEMPGVTVIRMMRSFRVFRLFQRVGSLRSIMGALTKSLIPMSNAFAIVCLVTAIYAIIFASFFEEIEPELFGSFFASLFTLFQAMTGDNWSEHCRELMKESGQHILVGCLYVSFMLLVSLVLVNVVIAVLLDAFGKAAIESDIFEASLQQEDVSESTVIQERQRHPFERIAMKMFSATNDFDLERQLLQIWNDIVKYGLLEMFAAESPEAQERIHRMRALKHWFRSWRYGHSQDWFLTADEFRRGVLSLEQYLPPLAISHKQFIEFVKPFCNFHGKIGRRGFQGVIACAMRQKQMNQISNAISRHSCSWNSETIGALLLGSAGLLREGIYKRRRRNIFQPRLNHEQDAVTDTPEMRKRDEADEIIDMLALQIQAMDRRVRQLEQISATVLPKWHTAEGELQEGHTRSFVKKKKFHRWRSDKAHTNSSFSKSSQSVGPVKEGKKASFKTAASREDVRQIFCNIDVDGSGTLELSEMEDFLAALGERQKSVLPSASRIFTFLDKDLSEAIEFDEFFDWYVTTLGDTGADVRTSKLKRRKEIRAIFDEFDKDHSGQWEIAEFQAFLDTKDLQTDEAQDIFDALDSDGSGSIDFNEFYKWHTTNF